VGGGLSFLQKQGCPVAHRHLPHFVRAGFRSSPPLLRNLTELLVGSSARVVLRSFTNMGKGNRRFLHTASSPFGSAGFRCVRRREAAPGKKGLDPGAYTGRSFRFTENYEELEATPQVCPSILRIS
jgi:hypothetical protein